MEGFVQFIIVAIIIGFSIVSNLKKEKAKHAKRKMQAPRQESPRPQQTATTSTPPRIKQPNRKVTQPQPLLATETINSNQSEIFRQTQSYQSSDDIYRVEEDHNQELEIGHDNFENQKTKSIIQLSTQDDFKKAIIYSAILERKY